MFDLDALTIAVDAHGRVARLVVVAYDGSAPREVGAAMLVWAAGQSGTIGGGALEWQAIQRARDMLGLGGTRLERTALGPNLGQCCGGAVSVLTEVYDTQTLPVGKAGLIVRPAGDQHGQPQHMPLAVKRSLAAARGQGMRPPPQLIQGWFIEPVAQPQRDIWIWGAGHVGRALVGVLAALPDVAITWIDVDTDRFPTSAAANVRILPVSEPERAVPLAPKRAEHLIVSYSHALDLALCHLLLGHGFSTCGLIGSATKWARFRSRLSALGHAHNKIDQIICPIGDPSMGKHPQEIAIGVAAAMIRPKVLDLRQEIAG